MSWGAASAESGEPRDLSQHRQIDTGRNRRGQTIVFRLTRGDRPRFAVCGEPFALAQHVEQGRAQRVVLENSMEHRANDCAAAVYRAVERIDWHAVALDDPKRRRGSSDAFDVPHMNFVGACIPAHYSFHPFSSTRQLPYN